MNTVTKIKPKKETELEISIAEPYDAIAIVRLIEEWVTASHAGFPEPNPYAVLNWVTEVLTVGQVVVARKKGSIRSSLMGVAGMIEVPFGWSPGETFYEGKFFYVPKAYKDTKVGSMMLSALRLKAAQEDKKIIFSIACGDHGEELREWYKISHGKYIGGTMMFDPAGDDLDQEENIK